MARRWRRRRSRARADEDEEDRRTIFGEPVTEAVITVPATLMTPASGDHDAGRIAGLEVAHHQRADRGALAYGLENRDGRSRKIVVYDPGGGTFDVDHRLPKSTVRSGSRCWLDQRRHLPGRRRLTSASSNFLVDEFRREQGDDLRNDPLALQRLKDAAEKRQDRTVVLQPD